ncbi:MAG TPA: imidazolonepropionase [Casimicrobiaceae bacterium]|nr:imidazolonepropionase [Casimicrobiaceae bacterium]
MNPRERDCDLLVVNVALATMQEGRPYGTVRDGALAVRDGSILRVGPRAELAGTVRARVELDGGGGWITPGLIDCHTHLVHAGNRAHEFEQRLAGATYEEIARSGGGILSTVRATREASEAELLCASEARLLRLAEEGVTTVEIKSGYGLDTVHELKSLRVARSLGARHAVEVLTTLLAAHAVPPEYAGRADEYVTLICEAILPEAAREGLADAVDAYCERIAFSPAQVRRVFDAARRHGLPVKLHADQLTDIGGAALAADSGALSADHLEHTSAEGVAALARAGTVAVLLPGAYYFLREREPPPVAALRAAGVPMAVATDCNPGTSPATSLLLMLNMACVLFGLTPEEALAGVTRNAARALGASERGRLAAGMRADFVLWGVVDPMELAYAPGANPLVGLVRRGIVARWP